MKMSEIGSSKEFLDKWPYKEQDAEIFIPSKEHFIKLMKYLEEKEWKWCDGQKPTKHMPSWVTTSGDGFIYLRNNLSHTSANVISGTYGTHLEIEWDDVVVKTTNSNNCSCSSPQKVRKVFSTFEFDFCSLCRKEI